MLYVGKNIRDKNKILILKYQLMKVLVTRTKNIKI